MAARARRDDVKDLFTGVLIVASVSEQGDELVPQGQDDPIAGLEIEEHGDVDAESDVLDADD